MKTVVDAVNELKGDFQNAKHGGVAGHFLMQVITNEYCGDVDIGGFVRHTCDVVEDCGRTDVAFVCTLKEFNQCVAEMSEAKWIPEEVNKMKTVGDFKKAGVVFVGGDVCKDRDGNTYKGVWYLQSNAWDKCYDNLDIKSFAWRENKGEKPSFSGLIDITTKIDAYNGVSEYEVKKSSDVDWRLHCCSHQVVKWRPSLNQPEQNAPDNETVKPDDKPVFTQEMAEAGELPPVGSKVVLIEDTGFYSAQHDSVCISDAGDIVDVVGHVIRSDNNNTCVTLFNGEGFVTINPEWCNPPDTRTPKQKAVDGVFNSVFRSDDIRKVVIIDTIEKLYDAGLLKC